MKLSAHSLVRFLWQAADPGEDKDVHDDAGGENPPVSADRRENAQAEHQADDQVCNDRKQKIHVQTINWSLIRAQARR